MGSFHMGSVKRISIYLFTYLFIYLFVDLYTSFAKKPGKLTEQAPLRGTEKEKVAGCTAFWHGKLSRGLSGKKTGI